MKRRHRRGEPRQALRPDAGARRRQPRRSAPGDALRAARAERRRQDDARAHPVHASCRPTQGRALRRRPRRRRASPARARSRIGVVFQEPSLDDRLTVRENLDFHGLVYGVPAASPPRRIAEMLALVELTDWGDRLVRTLSSGMKRRLEIARALVHDTAILFLDEPTVGLDVQSRARIWELSRAACAPSAALTVLVTTHYIEEVESFDRVCIIDHGQDPRRGHARRPAAAPTARSCSASRRATRRPPPRSAPSPRSAREARRTAPSSSACPTPASSTASSPGSAPASSPCGSTSRARDASSWP